MSRKRRLVLLAFVVVTVLLAVSVTWVLQGNPPPTDNQPFTRYQIHIDDSAGYGFDVLVPALVYPNGTLALPSEVRVTGNNGTLENATAAFGPAFRFLGNGTMWADLTYDFSGPVAMNGSRYPAGLPDLGGWTTPDADPHDLDLGAILVNVSGLPPESFVGLTLHLDYEGGALHHVAMPTAVGNGPSSIPIRIMHGSI